MRVAFVHDWLVTYRGGEKVLEALLELFPGAPIYTLFYDPAPLPASIRQRDIRTPRRIGALKHVRKYFLPLMPAWIEAFDLNDYDLILSSSSCVAKGVIPGVNAKHISYIHSPMRYIWDQRFHYFRSMRRYPGIELLHSWILESLRVWDVTSNHRVDRFIGNSTFVGQRIKRYYGVEADVVHPPVDLSRFSVDREKEDYFLAAGAFVPYKRFELAIQACESLKKRLVVAGTGPELRSLRALAGRYTTVVEAPTNAVLTQLMQKARGLIFPGVEDFGIIAIEALACGTPIIALKRGGALDYVRERINGLFFEQPTLESLVSGIEAFEKMSLDPEIIAQSAAQFEKRVFQDKILGIVQNTLK